MLGDTHRILAPIDFSENSMEALRAAGKLADELGAELYVVHVVAPHYSFFDRARELAREALLEEQAEAELNRIHKDQLGGSDKVKMAVRVGPPAQKIAEYATQESIDLILLATHGHVGSEHFHLGSNSEKIARLAPGSVMLYRPRRRER
jgi:nucleotide-binding universal stress UspA family protein